MPSSVSHAMMAVAGGAMVAPRVHLRAFLIGGAICAVVPDIDAIGRLLPVDDGDVQALGGHRGFTHSPTFAMLAGALAAVVTLGSRSWKGHRLRLGIFIAVITASHGVLDAFTSIGARTSPVQFFSPFSNQGFTSPWHPIHGPFGELFVCFLPLLFITRYAWHVRRLPWPPQRFDPPVTLSGRASADAAGAAHAAAIRQWIVAVLVVLFAFWGWLSETPRRGAASQGAGRAAAESR